MSAMSERPRILIADDNEDALVLLEDRLSRSYDILTAGDGEEALAVARMAVPDLILLDVMMPKLDGLSVCRTLKEDSTLPFIPIIMVTARADSRDIVDGLDAGADEYLTKPVDPEALIARVRSMLRIKSLQLELEEINRTLDARVTRQVEELERIGRLRRYLPPQIAQLIISSGDESPLKSHRRPITVVFCDLRGYTDFSSTAEPEDVLAILSEYHAELGHLIDLHDGTLERFTGDGMMVFFNDPIEQPDHQRRAVRMAVAMRERMRDLTLAWSDRLGSQRKLGFGVGVDHGYATLGRIGFEGRFDYAAIGSVTNRAARLCAEALDEQVLVSRAVYSAVRDIVETEPIGDLSLKGFQEAVSTYNILTLL
jgi:adenylate cyclase